MKCPKCNYTSFDHLNQCSKCGQDLLDLRERCGFTSDKAPGIDILKYVKLDNEAIPEYSKPEERAIAENEVVDGLEETILSDDDSMDALLAEDIKGIQDEPALSAEEIDVVQNEPAIEIDAAGTTDEDISLPDNSEDIELAVGDETILPEAESGGIEMPADFDLSDEVELLPDGSTDEILTDVDADTDNITTKTDDTEEIELSLGDNDIILEEPVEIELKSVSDDALESPPEKSLIQEEAKPEELEEITLDDLALESEIELEEEEEDTE